MCTGLFLVWLTSPPEVLWSRFISLVTGKYIPCANLLRRHQSPKTLSRMGSWQDVYGWMDLPGQIELVNRSLSGLPLWKGSDLTSSHPPALRWQIKLERDSLDGSSCDGDLALHNVAIIPFHTGFTLEQGWTPAVTLRDRDRMMLGLVMGHTRTKHRTHSPRCNAEGWRVGSSPSQGKGPLGPSLRVSMWQKVKHYQAAMGRAGDATPLTVAKPSIKGWK